MENVNLYISASNAGKITVVYPEGGKLTYNYRDPLEREDILRSVSDIIMKRGYKPLSIVRVGKHFIRNFVHI